jgi:hypothetical protein
MSRTVTSKGVTVFLGGNGAKRTVENNLEIAITAAVEDQFVGISYALKQDMEGAAQAAVDTLKSISPYRRGSGRGHYRSGWRHRIVESDWHYSAIVFNANKPTLTWLLEGGHELVRWNRGHNQKRTIGHVPGIPHIQRGYEAASAYLKSKGW